MRLKVRINVNNPLKQGWKVRSSEGNFVPILFKYEKLGIFCFLCGMLGHTDKSCPKLFDMEIDDGTRGWGKIFVLWLNGWVQRQRTNICRILFHPIHILLLVSLQVLVPVLKLVFLMLRHILLLHLLLAISTVA
jgi:14-3-3 protein epsilon